mmetsp:Transcript_120179/g.285559  ORF Transcript_120179/g.285559 Transcript_120179/m.285559 type:complete len:303 (-) Transcript_120179:184-1092(-)
MTMWGFFAYSAIPTGALLLLLLLSELTILMEVASKVMSAPITIGKLRLNAAVFMMALCSCLTLLSYSGFRREQMRSDKLEASGQGGFMQSWEKPKLFYVERNFWISLLGLMVWTTAWRLEAIFRSRPKRPPMALNLRASRLLWIAVGCAALLVADVPLCRLNYQMQLSYYVTPIKDELAPQAAACSGVFESNAQDQCVSFCQQVRKASEERQDCVMFARKWHILGKWAAEIFDFGRGVEQGPAHVNELFSRKSCEGVLQSVDKSNPTVNTFCALAAGVAMLAAFAAFAQVMGDLAETNLRKD